MTFSMRSSWDDAMEIDSLLVDVHDLVRACTATKKLGLPDGAQAGIAVSLSALKRHHDISRPFDKKSRNLTRNLDTLESSLRKAKNALSQALANPVLHTTLKKACENQQRQGHYLRSWPYDLGVVEFPQHQESALTEIQLSLDLLINALDDLPVQSWPSSPLPRTVRYIDRVISEFTSRGRADYICDFLSLIDLYYEPEYISNILSQK